MDTQTRPVQQQPTLNLQTEYWQIHQLTLSRQRRRPTGDFSAVPLCQVYGTAFDSADDTRRAVRLIQSAPELLRLLQRLATLTRATEDGEYITQLALEDALCDAEALTQHLTGE